MAELTPDFAEHVELPLNPLNRHIEVANILTNSTLPPEVEIRFAGTYPIVIIDKLLGIPVTIHSIVPLMGRRTLKKAAVTVEYLINEGE